MKEMTMLDLDAVDVEGLMLALDDHGADRAWFLDRRSGQVLPSESPLEEGELDWQDDATIAIDPAPSADAYADMEEFTARVLDPRPRRALEQALAGRGAFRRFKDALLDFPELRDLWFRYADVRRRRRALEWLATAEAVDPTTVRAAIDALREPQDRQLGRPLDVRALVEEVAHELRQVHGRRLRKVVLFGSWARGDADPESDIDLLVVLDRVESRRRARRRAQDLIFDHLIEDGALISQIVVSEDEYRHAATPLLMRVRHEGTEIA
jgi:hypothetical protein